MKEKAKVLDKEGIERALIRISHEIIEKNKDINNILIVGIRNRGEYLGKRIKNNIKKISNKDIPFGTLDITLYRDDLTKISEQPVLKATEIHFDITDKKVILVDDVLFTGRTIRCAMDELADFGRPSVIQLAVLIDRGHRELPIKADYVGKNVPTALNEVIEVKLKESDNAEEVVICEKYPSSPYNDKGSSGS